MLKITQDYLDIHKALHNKTFKSIHTSTGVAKIMKDTEEVGNSRRYVEWTDSDGYRYEFIQERLSKFTRVIPILGEKGTRSKIFALITDQTKVGDVISG